MNPFFRKILIVITMILFFVSIGHDLTIGTFPKEFVSKAENPQENEAQNNLRDQSAQDKEQRYKVIKHKVKAGDTVLSILESINEHGPPVTIQQMLLDFETLNPGENPNSIKMDQVYLFPYYHKNENSM